MDGLKIPFNSAIDIDIATCPRCDSKKDKWIPILQVDLEGFEVNLWQCMLCSALHHTKFKKLLKSKGLDLVK